MHVGVLAAGFPGGNACKSTAINAPIDVSATIAPSTSEGPVMDQRGAWIVRNGALAVALYVAVAADVGWIQYGIAAFAWWTLAATLWTAPDGDAGAAALLDPHPLAGLAFDLAVLVSMFLAQWYWSVFAYAAARGCSALIRARAARGS